MNAQALRKCVEEKEVLVSTYTEMVRHCDKLENECSLYERDLERIMDTCDELGKENEELKARVNENSEVSAVFVVVACSCFFFLMEFESMSLGRRSLLILAELIV